MIVRLSPALIAALAVTPLLAANEAAVLPEPYAADRYAAMKASTPFALATAEVAKPEANFARDMFISGVARIGNKDLVSVTTQDKTKSFTLVTGDPPIEGMQLLDVNWNDEVGKTTVQIKKGGDFATLQFNEMVIKAPAPMTVVPSPQPARGVPGVIAPGQAPGVPRIINRPAQGGGEDPSRPRRRIIRRPSQ